MQDLCQIYAIYSKSIPNLCILCQIYAFYAQYAQYAKNMQKIVVSMNMTAARAPGRAKARSNKATGRCSFSKQTLNNPISFNCFLISLDYSFIYYSKFSA